MASEDSNWLSAWQTRARQAADAFNASRRGVFYTKTDAAPPVAPPSDGDDILLPDLQRLVAQHLDLEIARLHPAPGKGTHHRLIRAELGNSEQIVFRLSGPGPVPAFELGLEEMLGPTLKRAGVPVPSFLFVDYTREIIPTDIAALDLAKGESLRNFEHHETQHMAEALLEDWGGTLALLHQITCQGFGLLDVRKWILDGETELFGLHRSWSDYVLTHLEDHIRICRDLQAINPPEAALIEKTFADAAGTLEAAPSRLLHGDPGHHNAFADGTHITAVIDWEDALAGDPVFDLAYWGTFVRDWMREPLLRGYSEMSPLPEDFERRYWLYYLRIALCKTVHRHQSGLKDREGRPPASQRIQRALANLGA